jgi:hypothetical protein
MARFLIRILCALALVLAAWPAGASAAPCVAPSRPIQQKVCAMPCCAKGPVAGMACHEAAPRPEIKAKTACPCEFKAALPMAVPSEKAALPTVQFQLALPPKAVAVATAGDLGSDPVVFGGDSSPPGEAQRRPSSPRAPPVVRV